MRGKQGRKVESAQVLLVLLHLLWLLLQLLALLVLLVLQVLLMWVKLQSPLLLAFLLVVRVVVAEGASAPEAHQLSATPVARSVLLHCPT